MSRFGFRTVVATGAGVNECFDAARQVLMAKGAKPQVEGSVLKARLGSFLKTRAIGGAFVPEAWLPTDIVVSVVDYGTQRQIAIDVGEAIGFGVLLGVETKLRHRCQLLAAELQAAVAQRLPASQPGPQAPSA